jgi:hypothetical protein
MAYQHITLRWDGGPHRGDSPHMRDLWVRLRCSLPSVLAAVLLPERAEIVLESDAEAGRSVQAAAQRAGLSGVRLDTSTLERSDLCAVLTAVHATPSTVSNLEDPLEWPWSTVRDLLGAVIDPWVTPPLLTSALGDGEAVMALLAEATKEGVEPAPRSDVPTSAIRDVLRAAAAATRRPAGAVRRPGPTRRLFVALANAHGWWMPRHVATLCSVGRRTLYRQLEHVPNGWVRAGALCLGDARLRALVLAEPAARRWDDAPDLHTSGVLLATDITKIL